MKLIIYENAKGDSPFQFWLLSLKDQSLVERIWMRILRIEEGNFGDHKYLREGVWELKMTFGGGSRIYYGIHKNEVVILLNGGNKHFQHRDINRAIHNWHCFLEQVNEKKNANSK